MPSVPHLLNCALLIAGAVIAYSMHATPSHSQPVVCGPRGLGTACTKLGFKGVSTHSFRRTTATDLAGRFLPSTR